MIFKPKHKFRTGELTKSTNVNNPELRHILITNKRWVSENKRICTFFKPKSKFDTGELVKSTNVNNPELGYMLITSKRWIRPQGEKKKQWVYDGIIIMIQDNDILVSTYISCITEKTIAPIDDII